MASNTPPALTTVPGLEILARHQQAHEARPQSAAAQMAEMSRQGKQERADEGFRGYTPGFQLSLQSRMDAWNLLLGRPLPDLALGPFEISLKSKEFAYSFCYGSNGEILRKTMAYAVDRRSTIWFEEGPNGPLTKLVVGLTKDPVNMNEAHAAAMVETWHNIRTRLASGSDSRMHIGVAAPAEQKDAAVSSLACWRHLVALFPVRPLVLGPEHPELPAGKWSRLLPRLPSSGGRGGKKATRRRRSARQ